MRAPTFRGTKYVGFVTIFFSDPMTYKMSYCLEEPTEFTAPPGLFKVWKFTKTYSNITVECNNIVIFEVVFSDYPTTSNCYQKWAGNKVKTMEFQWGNMNSTYCIGPNCILSLETGKPTSKYVIERDHTA